MRTVIVYYSLTGNCQDTAEKIAENIGADLLRIEPVKEIPKSGAIKFLWGGKSAVMGERPKLLPYSFNADQYDTVILGCPVWASTPAPSMKTFIHDNSDSLSDKNIAAFLCFSGGGADKALVKTEKLLGKRLAASIVLVDPKDKPEAEKTDKIDSFCRTIQDLEK